MQSSYTFLISLFIILLGYLMKRIGKLEEESGKSLAMVVINVTLPALILSTIPSLNLDPSLFLGTIIAFIFSVFMMFLSKHIFRNERYKAEAVMNSLGFNIGLFAYPIIEALFGGEGIKTIVMFDFGNAFIVFGITYIICYQYSERQKHEPLNKLRILKLFLGSLPFMSYIVALLLNLLNISLPGVSKDVVEVLAKANMGLVLLVLGLNLNFSFEKSEWRVIMKVILLRYTAGLVVGLILFFTLPFSIIYRTVILFGLILPIPVIVVPYSVEFGYNYKLSGSITNFTIIISFLIMWIMMIILF